MKEGEADKLSFFKLYKMKIIKIDSDGNYEIKGEEHTTLSIMYVSEWQNAKIPIKTTYKVSTTKLKDSDKLIFDSINGSIAYYKYISSQMIEICVSGLVKTFGLVPPIIYFKAI